MKQNDIHSKNAKRLFELRLYGIIIHIKAISLIDTQFLVEFINLSPISISNCVCF